MRQPTYRYFVGDFETTVYDGQDITEVWASASVELYTEDVHIFHSIDEQFEYLINEPGNILIYYHNLKFDGAFWLDYLITKLKYKQAFYNGKFSEKWELKNNEFIYSISSMGQWYSITIKSKNKIIEIRDSLKLLPFSVQKIGKSFGTKHKKLDITYEGFRYAGCEITDEEKNYISNDVLVIKEALEIMFNEGHKKITIGSCCLSEFKKTMHHNDYSLLFPNLYEHRLDKKYGSETVGEYIHKSYRGGWCYLVKGKENRIFNNGTTADVNSLYPSMMSSESGNRYPVGLPTFWEGNYIPDEALQSDKFYFIRIKTRFYLKAGMLPTIQIKNTLRYKLTEMLTTSDIKDSKTGEYYSQYIDLDGNIKEANVILTLTMMDYENIKKHYTLVDTEILDGCYFESRIGLFDKYMEKYKQIKMTSKGAKRELAKLFLNNLYGKMASSPNSNFKVCYEKEDGTIGFYDKQANDKTPGYIPIGSAITSYARNFTINAAQQNFHGVDKPGFIYADTDSIHCDLLPEEIVGITEHATNFCCWKLESEWDEAIFARQKTYIEHIIKEDKEPIKNPYYSVKCAGMPDKCKKLFDLSLQKEYTENDLDLICMENKYSLDERKFISTHRTLSDFRLGLVVPGKLLPKRIKGGVVLVETTYEMRG